MKTWFVDRFKKWLLRQGYVFSKPLFHQENEIDLRLLLAERLETVRKPLSVVQIGANDGVANDPLRHVVVSRGWHLLAVEPLAPAFARLVENYRSFPSVNCVRCAVSNEDGEATLYSLAASNEGDGEGQLASFSLKTLKRHRCHIADFDNRLQTTKVRALTLRTLLLENQVDCVDMLQVDTEGFDYEVIKMAFDMGLKPPILAFEWEHLDLITMWECRQLLIKNGYRWLVVKGDVIAAQESLLVDWNNRAD